MVWMPCTPRASTPGSAGRTGAAPVAITNLSKRFGAFGETLVVIDDGDRARVEVDGEHLVVQTDVDALGAVLLGRTRDQLLDVADLAGDVVREPAGGVRGVAAAFVRDHFHFGTAVAGAAPAPPRSCHRRHHR